MRRRGVSDHIRQGSSRIKFSIAIRQALLGRARHSSPPVDVAFDTDYRSGMRSLLAASALAAAVIFAPRTIRSAATTGVKRDAHGKIARDPHAKEAFRRSSPCPATGKTYGACPGYVIDHVQALKHGGADDPSNMQWQTREAAKLKDRWE
jgi:hypothetical protein